MGGSALSNLQCDNPACGRRYGHVGPGQYESGHTVYVGLFPTRVDLCRDCYPKLAIPELETIGRTVRAEEEAKAQRERDERAQRALHEAAKRGRVVVKFP